MRWPFAWLAVAWLLSTPMPAVAQTIPSMAGAEGDYEAGRFERAAERFRALAQADANNPAAWYGLGKSYEALARKSFSQLQAVAPGSEWEALLVADVWVTAGRFAQALSLYRDVVKLHPGVPGVHASIAALYDLAGHPEWADTERRREPPRPDTCGATAADCQFLNGRFLEALAAAGTREDAQALYWRIRALNALATEAFATLDTLPPSAQVHLVRAAIDRDQGRPVEAVAELKAALALSPDDRQIEQELAAALYESKNLDEALPLLKRLAGPAPTAEAEWAFFYGDALLQAQQVDAALPYLKAAAAARPDAPAVRASLGRALLQAGDAAAAIAHLQAGAADENLDVDGALHYQLAQAYQQLGRPDAAKAALAEYRKRQAAAAADAPSGPGQPPPGLTPP